MAVNPGSGSHLRFRLVLFLYSANPLDVRVGGSATDNTSYPPAVHDQDRWGLRYIGQYYVGAGIWLVSIPPTPVIIPPMDAFQ